MNALEAQKQAGMTMGLPLPTMVELIKFAEEAKARRKATAEKLLKDSVMISEELIKQGLLPDKDMN